MTIYRGTMECRRSAAITDRWRRRIGITLVLDAVATYWKFKSISGPRRISAMSRGRPSPFHYHLLRKESIGAIGFEPGYTYAR